MPKSAKTAYVCQQCGFREPKWAGKCAGCGEWNTFEEEIVAQAAPTNTKRDLQKSYAQTLESKTLSSINISDEHRICTGLSELDRTLGGGLVKGSLVLLGGDPGVGKSTILLQICEFLGKNYKILYVSGEESARQLKIRANRLGIKSDNLNILSSTDVISICDFIHKNAPDIVIIDSIQTMNVGTISSHPGSITQTRESANLLQNTAKELDIPTFLVGHVNKDGNIAGPKVLEHLVDTVLYLEGDRGTPYRLLRSVKNRYGATNEIGVFEMMDFGLREVSNPSELLISGREVNTPGSGIVCIMEGTRPVLSEIQGLVGKSALTNARRVSTGFDHNRLNILLAVLEKRAGYAFSALDVYINVVGGIKITEPAADLCTALVLISSLCDFAIADNIIAFGEIGLAGETRAVSNAESRIAEAARLGFSKIILPQANLTHIKKPPKNVELIGVKNINEMIKVSGLKLR